MIYKVFLTTDDVKDLHQRVYNQAKSWFTNLPLIPRVSSDKIIRFRQQHFIHSCTAYIHLNKEKELN